jgi:predicted RNA-binding protein with PUA-like domain
MAMFLLKSDPDTYSWSDLVRDGRTGWDGVRNATAQINLRRIAPGDTLLIYHSQSERAVVGIARALTGPVPDTTDPAGRYAMVELAPVKAVPRPIPLAAFKERFPSFDLVRISRLSVMPVPADVEAWLEPQL